MWRGEQTVKTRFMLVMGYLGAVIGAGFASGQEIMQFFVAYGCAGFKGIVIATVLFAICGGSLLYISHLQKISNYQEILAYLGGDKFGRIIDGLLSVFLFLGIGTMLSASGAVFHEHLYLPKTLGVFFAYFAVIVLINKGKKGLIFSFNFLVPVKLALLISIAGYAVLYSGGLQLEPAATPNDQGNLWLIASVLYVAYNFALATVVLTEYQSITTRKNGVIGAALGGVVLGFLLWLYYTALVRHLPAVLGYEVPMLYIAGLISIKAKLFYTIVLWVGILTTAIANAYGFSQRLASFTGYNYNLCLLWCMTIALPVGVQSFSYLVKTIYPAFGILGIILLMALFYRAAKDITIELYYNIIQLINSKRAN